MEDDKIKVLVHTLDMCNRTRQYYDAGTMVYCRIPQGFAVFSKDMKLYYLVIGENLYKYQDIKDIQWIDAYTVKIITKDGKEHILKLK